MKIPYKKLACIFLLGVASLHHAEADTCSPKQAEAADAMVDRLDSWPIVKLTFKKFKECDDGSIAEGNSEAIARLLVDKWSTLPQLFELIKDDPAFKAFVLRHIDTTLDGNDLEKIKNFSVSACPKGLDALCFDLRKAAENAINDSVTVNPR